MGQVYRWETARRYYCATVERDLLGDLIVAECHGGRWNNLGGASQTVVADLRAAEAALQKIAQRRRDHGYRLVSRGAVLPTCGRAGALQFPSRAPARAGR